MLKEDLSYYLKYTGGTYADICMSLPIVTTQKISENLEKILGFDETHSLKWENIMKKSPVFKKREKLREELDTLPGVLNIRSNILAGTAMFVLGIPAAELAWDLMYETLKNSSELVQYASNSLITLMTQIAIGYGSFMIGDIHANKEIYSANNSLSTQKIYSRFLKAVRSYLPFDLIYSGMKFSGQLYFLSEGEDPGYASAFADTLALPIFYALTISFGLHTGLIETKENSHKHVK
ncbi:MAG: hypothetical protein KC550_01195 [Nanoarchaeota archaeon]|nr:hypothetical protein [Nanoarchaeota archaeon]